MYHCEMLIDRYYKPSIIAAITRDKAIPNLEALKRVERSKTTKRPVFVVRFDRSKEATKCDPDHKEALEDHGF